MTSIATPTPHRASGAHLGRWARALGLCLMAALATGCASVMRVDSQVQTHARWTDAAAPAASASYRFDRLPSQTTGPEATAHAALEGMVAQALLRSGWQVSVADNPVRWQVQVMARTDKLPRAPWEDATDGRWMRGGLWLGNGGARFGFGGLLVVEPPYYQRSLTVLVRDTSTAQVVYESTANHDGRWNDRPELWQAMVDSALNGFPLPAAAVRQVNIDIPR